MAELPPAMAQVPVVFPLIVTVPNLSCAVPEIGVAPAQSAFGLNVAVTLLAALIVTVQVLPDTEVHPLQAEKVEPLAAVAVSVTVEPVPKFAEQVDPQLLIPAGELVTVPLPVPAFVTVNP